MKTFFHKLVFWICVITVLFVGFVLVSDITLMGLRIMLFGTKLVCVGVIFVALLYVIWHLMTRKK